jgi:hypothetical protein
MDNVFLFRDLETENKINNDHEYINILKDIPDLDGYLKIYNKKYSIFKNFVDTGRFRKFRKQFCEKNGISLLFDDRDVILKIPDYNDSRCIDYCIKAPIYLYNLTLFELSYIVRLSMILKYLKSHEIKTFGYCNGTIKKYVVYDFDFIKKLDDVMLVNYSEDVYKTERLYMYTTESYSMLSY